MIEVRPQGVVTADGREHEVDTIVWGTGFRATTCRSASACAAATAACSPTSGGSEGMQALRGTTFAGFPNLFMLVGPNTGLGHNSIIFMIESQLAYVMDALRTMDGRGAVAVDTRPEAQAAFNDGRCRPTWRAPSGPTAAAPAGTSTRTAPTG